MEEKFETVQIKYSETLQELDQIRKSQPPTQADISHRVSVQAEVDQGANEKLQQLQSEVHKLQDQIKEKDAEIKKLHEKLDHAHKEIEARDKTIQDLQHKTNKQADHSYQMNP